jgi:predicted DNA-binding WGR domain protein
MKAMKLVQVTAENNNKFINITPNADGTTFTSNWGCVGQAGKDTIARWFEN